MSDPTQPLPPGQPPPGSPPPRPELRRSRTDRMLGGVAGGLAHYLNVDPVIVRIGWAVIAIVSGGAAILAYILGWIIIPEEGHDEAARRAASPRPTSEQGRFIVGAVLVVAGFLWLAATIVPDIFRFRAFGALVLIAVGVLLVVQGARR